MKTKKCLSFVVALCMIISIIPADSAPASASDAPVYPTVINFTDGGKSSEDKGYVELTTYSNLGTPSLATHETFGFEVVLAPSGSGATNAITNTRQLRAFPNYLLLGFDGNQYRHGMVGIKVPAGTYRVFMKVPNATCSWSPSTIEFSIGTEKPEVSYIYNEGTKLGEYSFFGNMNKVHMFENIVTLPETEDDLRILSIKNAQASGWAGAYIESLYFVPVETVNAKFHNTTNTTFVWDITPSTYQEQLSYGKTGVEYVSSSGSSTVWMTTTEFFGFRLHQDNPTSINYNVLVPQTGKYRVDFTAGNRLSIANAPMTLKIAGTEVGSYNFGITNQALTTRMNDIQLTAGVNTLSICATSATDAADADGNYDWAVFPSSVKLTLLPELSVDEAAAVDTSVGKETNGSLTVKNRGAAYADATAATIVPADATVAEFSNVAVEGGKINYTVTGLKTGSTTATVTVTDADGGTHTDTVTVAVAAGASANIGTAEAGSPFASKYAYIEENNDGTYNVTFIGGINKLEGYSAVGFEIDVAGNKAYSDSANVYTSLDVNGSKYTAAGNYSASYIFIGSRESIAAGSKVVARPYVVVNGEKQFLANAELTLQF